MIVVDPQLMLAERVVASARLRTIGVSKRDGANCYYERSTPVAHSGEDAGEEECDIELRGVFRTRLKDAFQAASLMFLYSASTSLGVRWPMEEWRRF